MAYDGSSFDLKRNTWFKSIRARMTAAFALSIAALMLVMSVALSWYSWYSEERNADALLRMAVRKVAQERDEDFPRLGPAGYLKQEREDLQSDGLVAWLARKNAAAGADFPTPVSPRAYRTALVPVGDKFTAYTLVIGLPWRAVERRLKTQAIALVGLSLCVVLSAAVGAWFVVGRTLSPIAALASEADSASIDSLQVHLQVPSSDAEIVGLVSTLNGLLARLSQAAALQVRFYAAASHELRTPLHTLSGHLEVGLSRERSAPEYRSAMQEAYSQTQRLTSLVQDLLLLTQLQSGATLPACEPIDAADLCERQLRQLDGVIKSRNLTVTLDLTDGLCLSAPMTHAEMVVRNLLENAVKYAEANGTIRVGVERSGADLILDIFNECKPLGIESIRQLLEPFFRADASRHSETGGSGLGLAICDAIARANGWTLQLREEARGFRAVVVFKGTC